MNWDHEGEDFVVALDKSTGKERWRRGRDEITSWSTPLVVEHGGRAQVVVSATSQVRSYDLTTGEELWNIPGMTVNAIPSPVHADGIVYVMSGFRGSMAYAIDLAKAKGAIEGTDAVRWRFDRDTPYVPSPLLYDGLLYFLKTNNGLLTAVDAKTGKPHYQAQRLEGVPNVFASPVAAAGQDLRGRPRGRDRGAQAGADPRGARHQHARRSLRCLAGAGRRGDLFEGDEVPVFDRELRGNPKFQIPSSNHAQLPNSN